MYDLYEVENHTPTGVAEPVILHGTEHLLEIGRRDRGTPFSANQRVN
jgi:hypothetical protein